MSALVTRDPFARAELHRRREYALAGCGWCDNVHVTPRGRFYLYRYSVEHDGGRSYVDGRLFCCVDCRRAWYGER